MSGVGDLKKAVNDLGTNATGLARQLNRAKTNDLEKAVNKVTEVLGDSSTEVDKEMAAALDKAVEYVEDAALQLALFATEADNYARAI